jgi:hypothetical protein
LQQCSTLLNHSIHHHHQQQQQQQQEMGLPALLANLTWCTQHDLQAGSSALDLFAGEACQGSWC